MAAPGKDTAIKEAKTLAKMRKNYTCEKCGNKDRMIHGAHIMPVTWAGTAADPDNILCLCSTCHSVGRESAHEDPINFGRWFEEAYPGRYDTLREKALAYSKNPRPKIDWKEETKKIRQMQKDLE